jgi:hypothetical protein
MTGAIVFVGSFMHGPLAGRAASAQASKFTRLLEASSVGFTGTYRYKYPGYFKLSLFSPNELFLRLKFNRGNVRGARCNVGGDI